MHRFDHSVISHAVAPWCRRSMGNLGSGIGPEKALTSGPITLDSLARSFRGYC